MQTTSGAGSVATPAMGAEQSASVTVLTTFVGGKRKSTLNQIHCRCGTPRPPRLPRIMMLFASSCAFGTMMVDQSRVSRTVWRQRIAWTRPCLPLSSWIQSPSWIDPSSWRATPPRMFPSVLWSEIASTALTTAAEASAPVGLRPWVERTPRVAAM